MKTVKLTIKVKDEVTLEDIRQAIKEAGYYLETLSDFLIGI